MMPDIIINEDDHDVDAVVVKPSGAKLRMRQEIMPDGRRLDLIEVPEDLGPYDALEDSFQPTGWFIATDGKAETERGLALLRRLRAMINPREYASHLRAVSLCFLEPPDWCPGFIASKSWKARAGRAPLEKQAIPLYRVACDLLPKALYAEKTGKIPHDRLQALQQFPQLMIACGLALKVLKGSGGEADLRAAAEIALGYLIPAVRDSDADTMRTVMRVMASGTTR